MVLYRWAHLMFLDIRALCQHQTFSLRFINPMDYCKSLYCCWNLFGVSFHVKCCSSHWQLLGDDDCSGGVFGLMIMLKIYHDFLFSWTWTGWCLCWWMSKQLRGGPSPLEPEAQRGWEGMSLTSVFISRLTEELFNWTLMVTCSLIISGCLILGPISSSDRWRSCFCSQCKFFGPGSPALLQESDALRWAWVGT